MAYLCEKVDGEGVLLLGVVELQLGHVGKLPRVVGQFD